MVAFDVVSNIAIVFIMKNLKKNTRDALLFFIQFSSKKRLAASIWIRGVVNKSVLDIETCLFYGRIIPNGP